MSDDPNDRHGYTKPTLAQYEALSGERRILAAALTENQRLTAENNRLSGAEYVNRRRLERELAEARAELAQAKDQNPWDTCCARPGFDGCPPVEKLRVELARVAALLDPNNNDSVLLLANRVGMVAASECLRLLRSAALSGEDTK